MVQTEAVSTTTHIFVEVNRHEKKKITLETDQVTGQQIKTLAGVPLDNDLARRQGQKLELITNDQTTTVKDGEHFISLPPGTIS